MSALLRAHNGRVNTQSDRLPLPSPKRQTKSATKPHLLHHSIYSTNQHGFSNWSLKLAPSQLTVTQLSDFSHGDTKTQMLQTLDACINKIHIFPLYALGTDTHIGSPGNRHISISSTATPNATINIQRNLALPTRNHITLYPWALWLHTPPRQQAPYKKTRAHPAPPLSDNRQRFTAAVQVATITPLDKILHLRSSQGTLSMMAADQ